MTSIATSSSAPGLALRDRLDAIGLAGLIAFAAATQMSIAAAEICLTFMLIFWALSLAVRREPVRVPRMLIPLLVYAALTLMSSAFAADPRTSFIDDKQLVLFLIVPAVYQLARGPRAQTVLNVVITVGALGAIIGIVQYGVFEYDTLGRRPEGLLTHYMTYSGVLLLVICAVWARLLYSRDRMWPALMIPALMVALTLTSTRSAWVGACAAIALLLALRDFRSLTLLPIIAAIFFAVAPPQFTNRFYSMFDLKDPTTRDRLVMLQVGDRMIRARPLTGVGPDMVEREYTQYRGGDESQRVNPHLHNVPVQIAAERGLPALAVWVWFIVVLVMDLGRAVSRSRDNFLAAAGLAAVAGMIGAGLFEYNFGDSEFLMLFLVLVTLPYAAERTDLV